MMPPGEARCIQEGLAAQRRGGRCQVLRASARRSWAPHSSAGIGSQPQRDVLRLHRLPDHTYQVIAQSVQVGLVSELGRESLQRLCCIILPPVEAPIYEALDVMPQGVEQRGDRQGG